MKHSIAGFYQEIFNLSRHSPQQDAYLPYQDGQLLIVQNPESAKHILGKNLHNYPKRYDWFRQCIGISRFTENSPKWQNLKRVSQPFFNGFDKTLLLSTINDVMVEYRSRLISDKKQDQDQRQDTFNEPLIREMATDIFCRTFFDFKVTDLSLNFESITELLSLALQHAFIKPGELPGSMDTAVYQRIFTLRKEMLKGFKQLRDPQFHKSPFIQEIFKADQAGELFFEHELMFIFSIGIETTVHSLGWILYILAKHPELQHAIKKEISTNITTNSSHEDYANLKEVSNIIDWALRRYPPTPCISREALAADQIGDFKVQEGEAVIISILGLLYNPEDDIEKWLLNRHNDLNHNLAFGYGQRICGGKQYATVELIYLVTALLQNFDCELVKDEPVVFHWYAQLNRLGGHPIRLIDNQSA